MNILDIFGKKSEKELDEMAEDLAKSLSDLILGKGEKLLEKLESEMKEFVKLKDLGMQIGDEITFNDNTKKYISNEDDLDKLIAKKQFKYLRRPTGYEVIEVVFPKKEEQEDNNDLGIYKGARFSIEKYLEDSDTNHVPAWAKEIEGKEVELKKDDGWFKIGIYNVCDDWLVLADEQEKAQTECYVPEPETFDALDIDKNVPVKTRKKKNYLVKPTDITAKIKWLQEYNKRGLTFMCKKYDITSQTARCTAWRYKKQLEKQGIIIKGDK